MVALKEQLCLREELTYCTSRLATAGTIGATHFTEVLVLLPPLLSSEGPKQLTGQLIWVSNVKGHSGLHTEGI